MSQSNGFLVESKSERKGNTDPERAEQWRKASQRYRDKKRKGLAEMQERVDAAQREIEALKTQHSLALAELDKESKDNEMLWNSFAISPTAKMWREVFNFEERLFDLLSHWKRKRTLDTLPPAKGTPPATPNNSNHSNNCCAGLPRTSTTHHTPDYSNPPPTTSTALVTNRYFNSNDYPHHQSEYPPMNDKYNRMYSNNNMSGMGPISTQSFGNSGNSPSSYVRASIIQGSDNNNDNDGDDPDGAKAAAREADCDPIIPLPGQATTTTMTTMTGTTTTAHRMIPQINTMPATATTTHERGTQNSHASNNSNNNNPFYFLNPTHASSSASAASDYYLPMPTTPTNSSVLHMGTPSLPPLQYSLYSPLLRNDPLMTGFPSTPPSPTSTPPSFIGTPTPSTPEMVAPLTLFPTVLKKEA